MKSITVVFAILCTLALLNSCSSSRTLSRRYFGEGGSSQDTLFLRAIDSPVTFIFQRFRGEGGSSQDTLSLSLQPGEYGRIYKLGNKRKRKP